MKKYNISVVWFDGEPIAADRESITGKYFKVDEVKEELASICKRHTNEFGELKCGHELNLLTELRQLSVI